jgi:hypothetical protein
MTKKVLKDSKHRSHEKELDWVLERSLQDWIAVKPCLLDPEIQPILKRLYEFAHAIQSVGFSSFLDDLTDGVPVTASTIHLTELITDWLCQGICAGGRDIERKSLQETLYYSTGTAAELPPLEFAKRLESFLSLKGSKGLIQIFVGTHLSNLIVNDLRDSLRSAPDVLCGRLEAIDRICQKAAASSVRSLNTWSEPDPHWISAFLSDLKTKMAKASTSASHWKQITKSGSAENSSGRVLTATSRFSVVRRGR